MNNLNSDLDSIYNDTIVSATDAAGSYIAVSYGSPSMSPEDTKAALLMTERALQYQTRLNDALLKRIIVLEETTRKKFRRR